jgi:hypothetical protein
MRNPVQRLASLRFGVVTLAAVIALGAASTASARGSYVWPSADQRAYQAGCARTSGGNVALCRCQMKWLERRYSYRQMSALYLHHRKALILAITKASLACIK